MAKASLALSILLLIGPSAWGETQDKLQRGNLDIAISSRTFRSPLFGYNSAATFHVFGAQMLPIGARITVFLQSGAPSYPTVGSIRGEGIPIGGGLGSAEFGDVAAVIAPGRSGDLLQGNSYPVFGLTAAYSQGANEYSGFVGSARYFVPPPGTTASTKPRLAGGTFVHHMGLTTGAFDLLTVSHPLYLSNRQRSSDSILTATLTRALSPMLSVFSAANASSGGAWGGRIGGHLQGFHSEVAAVLYSFSGRLPYLYPLIRAGETGVEVAGMHAYSEFSSVDGSVNFLRNPHQRRRHELRASLGASHSFGTDAPYVRVSHTRNELTFVTLDATRLATIADETSVMLLLSKEDRQSSATLQYLSNSENEPNRLQIIVDDRRITLRNLVFTTNLIAQRSESDEGATIETAAQIPFRASYAYIVGIGSAYLHRGGGEDRGEGILRIGLSRSVYGGAWYLAIEARLPFSIGLPRARLARSALTLDLGRRLQWRAIHDVSSMFAPYLRPGAFGDIEGSVSFNGVGVAGVPVLLDNAPMAVTDASGKYRARRVPAGPATVTVDMSNADPQFRVVGDAEKRIVVPPKGSARADFVLGRFSYFQGALVRCAMGSLMPVSGAKLALVGKNFTTAVETSSTGSFQIDEIPPAMYQVIIDPSSVPDVPSSDIPAITIDLTRDQLGYVVRIGCGGTPGTTRGGRVAEMARDQAGSE